MRQPATVPGAGGMIKDMADDEAIQATNDDASECKRYAVQLGYWCDPFISLFVKQTARKAPEINRGYYARVKGIELFVDKFLKVSVALASLFAFPSICPRFGYLSSPFYPSDRVQTHRVSARTCDVTAARRNGPIVRSFELWKSCSPLSAAPSAPSAFLPAFRRGVR